ncbi:hypothetical protein BT96DRAFT_471624 [Gymnopus androsaceus JB14]|uniref:Uncharacterized protein n=1 Tax=Gymnopus androsaceus JB14 TaxID=1447944 RepID=A0A6A4IMB2_9AGAR|nr:hypothetical protein BT96DRAFT_471624 [Gymnopus androsaceus JB14]
MRPARRILDEEIVEDSEPEREAARLANSIIEISDDESPVQPTSKANDTSVIEISDSSMELPTGLPRCFLDYDPELDDSFPSLRLSKYAHIPTAPAGPSKPKITPSSLIRQMSTSSALPAKKPVAKSVVQRLTDEFPADSMSRLLVCVCCDSVWTTRKSVPQKLTHIKACAKKQGIKDDTLMGLVRKGIENAPPIQPKGKGKAIAEASGPNTFYDKVVHDAAPKKRTRRQEVIGSVKDIGETRDAIMQKARTIVARGDVHVRAIREHRVGEYASDGELSSTPRFRKSRLAKQLGFQAQPMFHNDGESPESPPAGFPPTLESAEIPQVLTDIDAHNLETPSKKKQINSRSPPPTPLIYVSSSSNQTSPTREAGKTLEAPSSPPLTPSPRKHTLSTFSSRPPSSPQEEDDESYPWDEELEQYADEAYLHYEPENDIDSLPPTTHIQPPSPINPSPKRRPKKPKSRSRSPAGTSTTAPRRKKKTATAKKQPEFDEEWDKDLRNRIVQDTVLHLRILRLEASHFVQIQIHTDDVFSQPIHFDVFLSMVDGQAEVDLLRN